MALAKLYRGKLPEPGFGYKVFGYNVWASGVKLSPQYRHQIHRKPLRGDGGVVETYIFHTNRWLRDATSYNIRCVYSNGVYKSGFHLFPHKSDAITNAQMCFSNYEKRYTTPDKKDIASYDTGYLVLPVWFDNVVAYGEQFRADVVVARDIFIIDDFNEF